MNKVGVDPRFVFKGIRPKKEQKSKKRLITTAFSLPLQTLPENRPLNDWSRPDEDFGFNPTKKKVSNSARTTLQAKKAPISKPIRATKRLTGAQNQTGTKSGPQTGSGRVERPHISAPTQVSSYKVAFTPKQPQKPQKTSLVGKGEYLEILKLLSSSLFKSIFIISLFFDRPLVKPDKVCWDFLESLNQTDWKNWPHP